jgi:hypothetical protein
MNSMMYDALEWAWNLAFKYGPWSDELNSIEEAIERAVHGYRHNFDDVN